MQNAAVQIGYFEHNPTFVENDLDPGFVFGLYDFEWELAMPYIEAAHDVSVRTVAVLVMDCLSRTVKFALVF